MSTLSSCVQMSQHLRCNPKRLRRSKELLHAATETGIIRAAGRGKDALVGLRRDAPDGSHLESLNARMARADLT